MRIRQLAIGVMAALALAACGSTDQAANPNDQTETTQPSKAPAVLRASTTALGELVADTQGRTAYIFAKDQAGSGISSCYGECEAKWPPVLISGKPTAAGVAGALGTITRSDGKIQVTLNGYPLYRFANDVQPGDTKGQNVNQVWFVVKSDGTPIK